MWTKAFWLDTLERAVKTAAQSAVAVLATVATFGDLSSGWDEALFLIGVATATSILTSIASSRVGTPADASLVTKKEGAA